MSENSIQYFYFFVQELTNTVDLFVLVPLTKKHGCSRTSNLLYFHTMMMAAYQNDVATNDKNNPAQHQQDNNNNNNNSSKGESPSEDNHYLSSEAYSARATIDGYVETGSQDTSASHYANPPPFLPKTCQENPTTTTDQAPRSKYTKYTTSFTTRKSQDSQPQITSEGVYINRAKRAKSSEQAPTRLIVENKSIAPSFLAPESTTERLRPVGLYAQPASAMEAARRELRMSHIKSAARAIDEDDDDDDGVVVSGDAGNSSDSGPSSTPATNHGITRPTEPLEEKEEKEQETTMPALQIAQQMSINPAVHSSNNHERQKQGASFQNSNESRVQSQEAGGARVHNTRRTPAGTPVSPVVIGTPASNPTTNRSGVQPVSTSLQPHGSPGSSPYRKHHEQHHAAAAAAAAGTRGIPHVYHDYASVLDTTGYVRKKTGGVTQPFPEKLHELLEAETAPDFCDNINAIVGWLPHGRAFLVRKPREFTRDIMPK